MSSTGAGSFTESLAGTGRALDVALGVSAAYWAVGALFQPRDLAVCVAIAAVHLTAATLFLIRRPTGGWGPVRTIVQAVPAAILSGIVIHLAGATWSLGAQAAFAGGATGVVLSLGTLGRSFAVLPVPRAIVAHGPYRWVRHPAYLSELIMVTAAASCLSWSGAVLFILAVGMFAVRIHAEETVLSIDPAFHQYRRSVRYRLIPLVW